MGFQELLLIGVIALLVMGPERLPGAIRTTTLWIAQLRRSFNQLKAEIENEIDADQLKRDFHNQSIMKTLEKTKTDVEENISETAATLKPELETLQYDINDVIKPHTEAGDTNTTSHNTPPNPDKAASKS